MTSHSKGIIRDNLGRWGMDLYLCGASDVAIIDTVIAMFRHAWASVAVTLLNIPNKGICASKHWC